MRRTCFLLLDPGYGKVFPLNENEQYNIAYYFEDEWSIFEIQDRLVAG